jgi:hypothetical protein
VQGIQTPTKRYLVGLNLAGRGVSTGSPFGDKPELTTNMVASAIGRALYEQLKTAPSFRFAIVGWEPEELRTYEELATSLAMEIVPGMVVEDQLVPREPPLSLQPFAPGYSWLPYLGERTIV